VPHIIQNGCNLLHRNMTEMSHDIIVHRAPGPANHLQS
jgi:hypothetical protein